jgi:hypothetical protein
MTRRDFELIAAVVRDTTAVLGASTEGTRKRRRVLAEGFARELVATNPRFNHERFLRACEAPRDCPTESARTAR